MKLQVKRAVAIFLAAMMFIQTPFMQTVQAETVSENQLSAEPEVEEAGVSGEAENKSADIPDEPGIINETQETASDDLEKNPSVSSNAVTEHLETVSENTVEETLLNWIYIENSYIQSPGTQSILVSIGDENTGILEGTLTYENTKTKETFEVKASEAEGTAFLTACYLQKILRKQTKEFTSFYPFLIKQQKKKQLLT